MKIAHLILGFIFCFGFIDSAGAFGQKAARLGYYSQPDRSMQIPAGGVGPQYTVPVSYSGPMGGSCTASCSGGAINIDVTAQCMCVGSHCFKIDIGRSDMGGAMMSTNGTGIMGDVNGAVYKTLARTTTTYDNDAISFGYPSMNRVGKWIHKSAGCGPGGSQNTIGCIGVPCAYWPEVKSQKGKQVVVCRANTIMTSINGTAGAPRATGGRGWSGSQ